MSAKFNFRKVRLKELLVQARKEQRVPHPCPSRSQCRPVNASPVFRTGELVALPDGAEVPIQRVELTRDRGCVKKRHYVSRWDPLKRCFRSIEVNPHSLVRLGRAEISFEVAGRHPSPWG